MMNIYMGRWRTRLARRSEKPRTVVRLHPVPPTGMHDAFLVSPRFPFQQSDRRLYNQNPIEKTGIRRSMASQFPFCGTLSLCFHFMPPHKIQRAMAAGSVSFSIYLEIYRNKNYYIAESFYIQARSGLFFTLLFSNILIWRGTQVAQGDPLLRGQPGKTGRGFESRPLRQELKIASSDDL